MFNLYKCIGIGNLKNEWFLLKKIVKYHIAGNFYMFLMLSSQSVKILIHQIFKATQYLVKDSDHPSKYFPWNDRGRKKLPINSR